MTNSITWSTFGDVKRGIDANKSMLSLVGYGVTYIQPTCQSLEYLAEFQKDPGEFKDRVQVFLIDEEHTARKFCDDNEFVVGTPILQVFYNGKSVRYRFIRREDTDTSQIRPTNVYVAQLHISTIRKLVALTFEAIEKQSSSSEGIIVDADVDALSGTRQQEYESEEEDEDDEDSETDTGEDTTEESEEHQDEEDDDEDD